MDGVPPIHCVAKEPLQHPCGPQGFYCRPDQRCTSRGCVTPDLKGPVCHGGGRCAAGVICDPFAPPLHPGSASCYDPKITKFCGRNHCYILATCGESDECLRIVGSEVSQSMAPEEEGLAETPDEARARKDWFARIDNYHRRAAEFEARKTDVYRRLEEIARLRNECRDRLPACSRTGDAYDEGEATRRRDLQYFTWGEASYYIPWSDVLTDVPPGLAREIGTWGGIKIFGYGGDKLWIWLKENVVNFGSTPSGGLGEAQRGWQKAYADNQGVKP